MAWGNYLLKAKQQDVERQKQLLSDYELKWEKFIKYCHTGKFDD